MDIIDYTDEDLKKTNGKIQRETREIQFNL